MEPEPDEGVQQRPRRLLRPPHGPQDGCRRRGPAHSGQPSLQVLFVLIEALQDDPFICAFALFLSHHLEAHIRRTQQCCSDLSSWGGSPLVQWLCGVHG